MLCRRAGATLLLAVAAALLAAGAASAGKHDPPERPSRVMILVVDQFLPEYVDRFDMDNVRALMRHGATFDHAILGHMAAETVITHNVLTSGLFPKHMGWSNEVYRDVGNKLGGPVADDDYYVTSSLSCGQFDTLLRAQGYPKLDDHLGGKFISVGQKPTAVCPGGHPADAGEDIIVHIGSGTTCNGVRHRAPGGANVPAYINQPVCGRFYPNTSDPYGTTTTSPAWMYPLDGHRFVSFDDHSRPGGDVWTADAAIELLRNEGDWKGMMVSLGSVDKMAHMWGTDDAGPSGVGLDVREEAHLPYTARKADEQVGRLMAELDALGIRDETLVVLTTDHAGQTAHRYHGLDGPDRGNFNWYYGADADETYLSPAPDLAPLVALEPNLDFSYQDGHVAAWLQDRSPASLAAGAAAMRQLPDVIASYVREGDRYRRVGPLGAMTGRELVWWAIAGQQLIDTMAAPYGPDVVGLLRDDTSYGVRGDHGGHQLQIQHIPMAFNWPGLKPRKRHEPIRAVDVLPTVLELMGVPKTGTTPLDGKAYELSRRR
jgi:Type I phosphodiesterase / nucleotide pyrophosphatase